MTERRAQPRVAESELVIVRWHNGSGYIDEVGSLQDISLNGMNLFLVEPVHVGTEVKVFYASGERSATVRHHAEMADGHRIGIEFSAENKNPSRVS